MPQSKYAPPIEFSRAANADSSIYERAILDREAFWSEQANRLFWHSAFSEVLDWRDAPVARWFADGELNVTFNCVDRHVLEGFGSRVAIHWEGEPGDSRDITYSDLLTEISQAANYFTDLGLTAGDRV